AEFWAKSREWGISVLDLPTTYWHELARESASQIDWFPPSLRLVIIGGERALPQRLAVWKRSAPKQVRLVNSYGPTEATIVATMCSVESEAISGREVSIGRPVRNTEAYILDQQLTPVPINVPGQLYLGGSGLARGYLNRPALTAEKFIPH